MAACAAPRVTRFALIDAGSTNLGDEIQAIAAAQFLPRVDTFLPREALNRPPVDASAVLAIMNGWYMARPEAWPPHSHIVPVPVSMHLSQHHASRKRFWIAPASTRMLTPEGKRWFRTHEPIGARDVATRDLLRSHGIDAYHSGCLTLTLAPRSHVRRHGRVVACDLTPPLFAALARRIGEAPLAVTHIDAVTTGVDARMRRAQQLLDLYAGARAVVTTRLHCALPCLALGTPVLFIPLQRDRYRLQPAIDLAASVSARAFVRGAGFDLQAPPANPATFRTLAQQLRARVRNLVAMASPADEPVE